MKMRRMVGAAAALVAAAALAVPGSATAQEATGDIVETASAAGTFNTLLAAAEAASLVDTLKGEGPFTLFAPTDDAFNALPAGTVEGLLADPEALAEVLLYHVVAGRVLAADVVGLTSATTVQGADIAIEVVDGAVVLNGATTVTATDVLATNGVIHVIDGVLLPPVAAPTPAESGNAGLQDSTTWSLYAFATLGAILLVGGAALATRRAGRE